MDFRDNTREYATGDDVTDESQLFSYSSSRSVSKKVNYGARQGQDSKLVNGWQPTNLVLEALASDLNRMLAPALKPVALKKEQFIYQEGDRLESIYFPVTAVVSEFKILEDGRMVEIAVTGNDGAIGLASMFSNQHFAPNFTQVSQAGTAKKLDAYTFEKLIRSDEALRMRLSGFVELHIKQISQKAICNMYHSVKERLCTWLLMVQDRCGRSTLNLTHEQIARTLGVYRPSITCIAQELREMKLIDYSRGGISIRSRDRVEKSACTCYHELAYPTCF